jgi:DNA-binding transcriptional MerR regulator
MAWSIAQVARMSKVTSRTLRHYDEIGLLSPAWVGGNGYRYYEREQLARLQQILVLRELGVGLETIAEIVHQGRDQVETLRLHRKWLLAERDRFQQLVDTVTRTIDELEGGDMVNAKSMDHWFEGFSEAKAAEYEEEAKQRWGAEEVEKANRGIKGNAADWWRENGATWAGQLSALIDLIDAGSAPDAPEALDVIDGHYRWISGMWVPNRESYTGLGNLYADDPRFRANFDKTDPRLAEFLRAAMAAYAQARLE